MSIALALDTSLQNVDQWDATSAVVSTIHQSVAQ